MPSKNIQHVFNAVEDGKREPPDRHWTSKPPSLFSPDGKPGYVAERDGVLEAVFVERNRMPKLMWVYVPPVHTLTGCQQMIHPSATAVCLGGLPNANALPPPGEIHICSLER